MIITANVEVSAATTDIFVQVPCACSLLAVRTAHEETQTGTLTLSHPTGPTDVLTAGDISAAAGIVATPELLADSIVKNVIFDIDKPIKAVVTVDAAGVIGLLFELDEFVRKTD